MAKKKTDNKRMNHQLSLVFVRYYKVITVILIIIIFGLSYSFILKPKYDEVGRAGGKDLNALNAEFDKQQTYLENLQKFVNNYNAISQTELTKFNNILPDDEDIPGLFVQFQTLAEDYNLSLTGISINEAPDPSVRGDNLNTIGKLNINIDVVGREGDDYNELKDFLAALELNLRIFDINAVNFIPGVPAYSIGMFTYFSKD